MAFQVGLRQLWRERVLGRYLHGDIGRDEGIDAVGIDLVELAERQHKARMEDLAWAQYLCNKGDRGNSHGAAASACQTGLMKSTHYVFHLW